MLRIVIKKYSFFSIALILVIFETIVMLKGRWAGDFWEHSAVVKELSQNLLHPSNPIIKSEIAHAFFSPYSVMVAVFSKITSLNSIEALTVFGFLNLILFLFSIYFFSKTFFKENSVIISALSLVLILLFWGGSPFLWSGFFHFFVLHKVLPYPSTFAFALSLIGIALVSVNDKGASKTLFLVFIFSLVLLTHPPTAIFLGSTIFALSFSFQLSKLKAFLIIGGGFTLCLAWPYYSIVNLILDNNIDFSSDSKKLYIGFFDSIHRYWPSLLCIPVLFFVKKDKLILFFSTTIVVLVMIYIGGWVFKVYAVSRVISYIMIVAYFLMAYLAVRLFEENNKYSKHYLAILSFSFLVALYFNANPILETLSLFNNEETNDYKKYNFLRTTISDTDVVLSDESTNTFIPSFGGRVLASRTPLYWLPDHHERRDAVNLFFSANCTDEERLVILKKHKPNYILIDTSKTQISNITLKLLYTISESSIQNNQFNLIKLHE